ncbi:MAG: hypothetical protein V3W17_00615 [Desulfobacteria bacterium]
MRRILTGYVVNFNKRHRYGHLFQNRYKSIVCQEDVYLKELVRYIHLNLLRAGLVKDIKELNQNPWSGHSALGGKVKRGWQDTEHVLSFFGRSDNSRRNYLGYVKKGIDQGRRPELVGGGLIRSMGGWSAGRRFSPAEGALNGRWLTSEYSVMGVLSNRSYRVLMILLKRTQGCLNSE